MRVWITKYALTQGIFRCEAKTCFDINPDMIEVPEPGCYGSYYYRPDWHETREAAVARAEEMRKKKIASLKKQLAKLTALKFE